MQQEDIRDHADAKAGDQRRHQPDACFILGHHLLISACVATFVLNRCDEKKRFGLFHISLSCAHSVPADRTILFPFLSFDPIACGKPLPTFFTEKWVLRPLLLSSLHPTLSRKPVRENLQKSEFSGTGTVWEVLHPHFFPNPPKLLPLPISAGTDGLFSWRIREISASSLGLAWLRTDNSGGDEKDNPYLLPSFEQGYQFPPRREFFEAHENDCFS